MTPPATSVAEPTTASTAAPASSRTLPRRRQHLRELIRSTSSHTWAVLDIGLVGVATVAVHTLLLQASSAYEWLPGPLLSVAAFSIAFLFSGLVFGLYERVVLLERTRILLRSGLTVTLAMVLGFAFHSFFLYMATSRWLSLAVGCLYFATAVPLRLFAHGVLTSSHDRILCIGSGASIRKLSLAIARSSSPHYKVVGHVQVPQVVAPAAVAHSGAARFWSEDRITLETLCPCLGSLTDLPALLTEDTFDEVVVGSEDRHCVAVGTMVATCLDARKRVTDQATFMEKLLGEVPAESITPDWFLQADVQRRVSLDGLKRIMDVVTSLVGLALTLPLWPLIAAVIRLDGRGPIFFRQTRVGQYGRLFTIYKFRTMRVDAERNGARWAEKNDARVTRMGRFLRRSRLDELPQLLNILRGDMSLVGPRPERPEFVHTLEEVLPNYRLRHLIKPGLSGWAQIHYGYGASIADAHRKLCYDLYYLKHRSIDLDIGIIVRTMGTCVLGAR